MATLLFLTALGPVPSFGFYLAFLGVVALWMGYTLDWIWLRWPIAFVADLCLLVMAGSVTGVWQREGAGAVMVLQLAMFAGYLISIAVRTLWRSRDVIPFEVVQTVALLVAAFGGAVYVMRATGAGATGLGIASLVFGIGSYGVAFAFVDRSEGHWKNFVFYSSLAIVFVLAGVALTVGAGVQAMAWSGLALAAAVLGYRYSAAAVGAHSAIYLVAGGIASGLFAFISDAFTASVARGWAAMSLPAWIVLASAAASAAIPVTAEPQFRGRPARIPQIVVVVMLLAGVGAVAIGYVVPLAVGRPRPVGRRGAGGGHPNGGGRRGGAAAGVGGRARRVRRGPLADVRRPRPWRDQAADGGLPLRPPRDAGAVARGVRRGADCRAALGPPRVERGLDSRSDPYFADTPQMSRQYSRMVRSDEK